MTRWLIPILGLVVGCARPDKPIESGRGFVTTVYADTEVEQFSRSTQHLTGAIAARGDTVQYVVSLGDSSLVRGVDLTATARRRGERQVIRRHYTMPKSTMPMLSGSGALVEQLLRRVRTVGGDSVSIPVMMVGANASLDVFTVTSNGPDSLIITGQTSAGGNELHVAIDSLWHVTGGVLPISGMVIRPL